IRFVVAAVVLAGACGWNDQVSQTELGQTEVRLLVPRVVAEHPHDPGAFTQGLELVDGLLVEGTGLYGSSTLRVVDRTSGKVLRSQDLADGRFGEGVTALGDGRVVQLTWKAGRAVLWRLDPLVPVGTWDYDGEGWGVCRLNDDTLATSDGSATITLRRSDDFSPIGSLEVTLGDRPVDRLNELECVGSTVWANVWLTARIVAVNAIDGRVTAVVDASDLPVDRSSLGPDDVLNGIAHDPDTNHFLLTGKHWPSLFEVELVEAAGDG
ncbi:MAG: glutaminyl-peptide cyclotransferase, partial [Acidimicrobiales bacterium]|nr:glutaminyl-peptide cyclotransferase [Acidimicrobiales bacterium]